MGQPERGPSRPPVTHPASCGGSRLPLMKLGIMSDVHGNDVALRAVLDDAAGCQVDRWWVLGDTRHFRGRAWPCAGGLRRRRRHRRAHSSPCAQDHRCGSAATSRIENRGHSLDLHELIPVAEHRRLPSRYWGRRARRRESRTTSQAATRSSVGSTRLGPGREHVFTDARRWRVRCACSRTPCRLARVIADRRGRAVLVSSGTRRPRRSSRDPAGAVEAYAYSATPDKEADRISLTACGMACGLLGM